MTADVLRGGCYVLAAAVCFFAGSVEWSERRIRARTPAVWLILGLVMLAVAATEWWNFGNTVADVGRSEAKSEGWYGERRRVQMVVIVALVVAALLIWILVSARLAARYRRYLPPVTATVFLACFVVVRGISLHSFDAALGRHVLGSVRPGDLVEVAAALAVSGIALLQITGREIAKEPVDVVLRPSSAPTSEADRC